MSEQFTLITTHTVGQDKLDEYLDQNQEYTKYLKANEPDVMYQQVYIDKDQTEVTAVLAFTDVEAADTHMRSHENPGPSREFTTSARIEVYGGTPGPVLADALKASVDAGIPVSVKPSLLSGFTRQPKP